MGYKYTGSPSSSGIATFYVSVPANANGSENTELIPVLKKGTVISSDGGANFILTEDIDFSALGVEKKVIKQTGYNFPSLSAQVVYLWLFRGNHHTTSQRCIVPIAAMVARLEAP